MTVNIFYKDWLQLFILQMTSNDNPVENIDTFQNVPNNGTVVDRSWDKVVAIRRPAEIIHILYVASTKRKDKTTLCLYFERKTSVIWQFWWFLLTAIILLGNFRGKHDIQDSVDLLNLKILKFLVRKHMSKFAISKKRMENVYYSFDHYYSYQKAKMFS